MRHLWAFILLSAAGISAGCGQKGPLVHPDAAHKPKPVTPGAAPSTAPATPAVNPPAAPQS